MTLVPGSACPQCGQRLVEHCNSSTCDLLRCPNREPSTPCGWVGSPSQHKHYLPGVAS